MTEVLLFHHAHGRTPGVNAFADQLRAAGHTVHVPDLYQGQVFESLEDGIGHARQVGFETLLERGVRAADELPDTLVYAGFSLGVMPAQKLAQTRPGAAGALLLSACLPASEFGGAWPDHVPAQVHGMEADAFFIDDGDVDAAREIVASVADAELFLYPGDAHLFADNSLVSHDDDAAGLVSRRVLTFLDRVG
ncbi:MAG TPA: dienelactone hydrolase family protein [Euzebya sp.]|nr:dienelactone hydrolase family protein [Euzebya sp.]